MDITGCLWPTRIPLGDEYLVFRFLAKVEIVEECWEWQGSLKKPPGLPYGFFTTHGKVRLAHRVAYEWWVGPLDPKLEVKHLCSVPPCVNPQHLEQDTRWNNLMESEGITAENRYKTECPQGHPYSGVNINGARICKICNAANLRKSRAKRKGM